MDPAYGITAKDRWKIGQSFFDNSLIYSVSRQLPKDNEAIIGNRLFVNKTIVLDLREKMGCGFC